MSVILHDEKRSFLFFLLLLFLTVGLLAAFSSSPIILGWLGLLWSGFGFFRLLFLYQTADEKSDSFLTLSSRILFGLGQQQDKKRALIFNRFMQADIIFWLVTGTIYVSWAVYCSLFPADIGTIANLQEKQVVLLGISATRVPFYTIITALSFYVLMALITFLALSFSYSATFVKWALYSIFPVFALGVLASFIFFPWVDSILWPDIFILKGAGLGRSEILTLLTPEKMQSSGSFLMRRAIELGFIGSFGLYALFLPAFIFFIKFFRGQDQKFLPTILCGFICLLLLGISDIFLIVSPVFKGLGEGVRLLGGCLIVMCWSYPGYQYLAQILGLRDRGRRKNKTGIS